MQRRLQRPTPTPSATSSSATSSSSSTNMSVSISQSSSLRPPGTSPTHNNQNLYDTSTNSRGGQSITTSQYNWMRMQQQAQQMTGIGTSTGDDIQSIHSNPQLSGYHSTSASTSSSHATSGGYNSSHGMTSRTLPHYSRPYANSNASGMVNISSSGGGMSGQSSMGYNRNSGPSMMQQQIGYGLSGRIQPAPISQQQHPQQQNMYGPRGYSNAMQQQSQSYQSSNPHFHYGSRGQLYNTSGAGSVGPRMSRVAGTGGMSSSHGQSYHSSAMSMQSRRGRAVHEQYNIEGRTFSGRTGYDSRTSGFNESGDTRMEIESSAVLDTEQSSRMQGVGSATSGVAEVDVEVPAHGDDSDNVKDQVHKSEREIELERIADICSSLNPANGRREKNKTILRNDYSQNFINTNQRPQNSIRDSPLTDRFLEYPKLRELTRLKSELVSNWATPAMCIKTDLFQFDLRSLGTRFDVILVDPPVLDVGDRSPFEFIEEVVRMQEGGGSGGVGTGDSGGASGSTSDVHAPGTSPTNTTPHDQQPQVETSATPPFTYRNAWTWDEVAALPLEDVAAVPSFVFLWTGDGEGLERGRDLLAKWGYRRAEDIVWVKTNKSWQGRVQLGKYPVLQRQKEHCLVGIKGTLRRAVDTHFIHCNVDTDVIVAEEPMRGFGKPEELYTIIQNFCLGRRRLELFATDNNVRPGWLSIGAEISQTHYDKQAYLSYFENTGTILPFHSEIEMLRPKSPPMRAPRMDWGRG
ncbi:N6-adenosine-methyltransferase subunit mettl14 [Blyttiomyces sp. JEL0837]|nr:N6-adenosine-methyltransferase subunit mettl14 [Blyttiomyces sp. JEL0837]